MRLLFFNCTLAQFLAVFPYMLISEQSFAQQQVGNAQPVDKKLETSGYLVQADRELECNPEGAKVWAKMALNTASSARETEPAMIDTLGDLKSQSNIKIVEVAKRLDLLNETAREARGLIKQAKLETAQGRLKQADPKGCYSGFKSVRSEIDEQKSKADALVKQGDAVVDNKPKEAIKFYASARRFDAESPRLNEKSSDAKNPLSRGRSDVTFSGQAGDYVSSGTAKLGKYDWKGAAADFATAIRLRPDDLDAYFGRGRAEQSLGLTDFVVNKDEKVLNAAIADFTRAIEMKPDYAEAYRERGVAKNYKNDFAGAIPDFTRAIALKPDFRTAYIGRGAAEMGMNNFDAAISDFTALVQAKSDDAFSFYRRGQAKEAKGDVAGANSDFVKAREIQPNIENVFHPKPRR